MSSAGAKLQVRTAAVTASIKGGVWRSGLMAVTRPVLSIDASNRTSPPPTAITGIWGMAPPRYCAGDANIASLRSQMRRARARPAPFEG